MAETPKYPILLVPHGAFVEKVIIDEDGVHEQPIEPPTQPFKENLFRIPPPPDFYRIEHAVFSRHVNGIQSVTWCPVRYFYEKTGQWRHGSFGSFEIEKQVRVRQEYLSAAAAEKMAARVRRSGFYSSGQVRVTGVWRSKHGQGTPLDTES